MKHLLLTTIAAVLLVGCGESQRPSPPAEAKPVEPVAEATKPEPPTAKAPDISIHDAAKKGNIEAVKQHLAAGTDVNGNDKYGSTPLLLAVINSHKGKTSMVTTIYVDIVELLIAKGADVNAKGDQFGNTSLHFAAGGGHKEIVELLIANGADVNFTNPFNLTALDQASMLNFTETIDLLRKHGGKTGEELKAEEK